MATIRNKDGEVLWDFASSTNIGDCLEDAGNSTGLDGLLLSGAEIINKDLSRILVNGGLFKDVLFKNCVFVSSRFIDTSFENCKFHDCVFRNALFDESLLINSQFSFCLAKKSLFRNNVFDNSFLEESSFMDSLFNGSSFKKAKIMEVSFNGSGFHGVDLSKAVSLWNCSFPSSREIKYAQCSFSGMGQDSRMLTGIKYKNKITIFCGCFKGSPTACRKRINDEYKRLVSYNKDTVRKGFVKMRKTRRDALEFVVTQLKEMDNE